MKDKRVFGVIGVLLGALAMPVHAISVAVAYSTINDFGVSFSAGTPFFSGFTFSNDAAADSLGGVGAADLMDAPAACVGACSGFDNDFVQHGQSNNDAYSYGDALIANADVLNANGSASVIGDVLVGAGIAYASGANVMSARMYNVTPGSAINFSFDADLFLLTAMDQGGSASANSFFNITLLDGFNNTVFEWLPNGSVDTVVGGIEHADPFSLNTGIAFDSAYNQTVDSFSASTNVLAGGTYKLNIKMETKVNANAVIGPTSVVPVPAAIWLFISGVMGLVAASRYKKM